MDRDTEIKNKITKIVNEAIDAYPKDDIIASIISKAYKSQPKPNIECRALDIMTEAGAACGLIKRLARGGIDGKTATPEIAEKFADLLVALVVAADDLKIELHKAVTDKLDATTLKEFPMDPIQYANHRVPKYSPKDQAKIDRFMNRIGPRPGEIQPPPQWTGKTSSIYCNHANEAPARCDCPESCSCRAGMCSGKTTPDGIGK